MTECEKMVRYSVELAKDSVEMERQAEAVRRLDIYRDNWSDHLRDAVYAQFNKATQKNVAQLLDTTQNILKRVIYLISQVYSNGATRKALLGEDVDERYEEIIGSPLYDVKMSEVNRYANLLGECFIGIVPEDGEIKLIVLTPDLVTVTQKDNDPTQIDSLTYHVSYVNSMGNCDVKKVYWDIYGNHRIFDAGGLDITKSELPDNPEGINPFKDPENEGYTIIPFVTVHKSLPIWDFWGWTEGKDLVDGTLMVGVLLTYVNYMLKVNSFKQLTLTGISAKDIPEELVLDPLFPLRLSGEGNASVLDYSTDPNLVLSAVKDKINGLINAYGINGDIYRASSNASSGYALKLSREELYQRREEQVKVYKAVEFELFEKIRIVNNTSYPNNQINPNAEFSIDFNEMLFSESPTDIREQWTFDIELGVKSIVDYMIYLNPDMTEEEALAKIDMNRQLNGKAKAKGLDVEGILTRIGQKNVTREN